VDLVSQEEQEFSWKGEAAEYFKIDDSNICGVLSGKCEQFNVGLKRYAAQYLPKMKEWNFNILPRYEAVSLANRKPLIVVNLDTQEEKEFTWKGEAAEYFNIQVHNIQNVLTAKGHEQFNVGLKRYAAQYLPKMKEWNFNILPSMKARALKQSKKMYYVDASGKEILFNSRNDAAAATCGLVSVHTQKNAITKSCNSGGNIACKAGYFWHLQ
jgi:hypothetical protein